MVIQLTNFVSRNFAAKDNPSNANTDSPSIVFVAILVVLCVDVLYRPMDKLVELATFILLAEEVVFFDVEVEIAVENDVSFA